MFYSWFSWIRGCVFLNYAELKLSDIDTQFRYVKVFGKGRKEREIGLHPEVGKLVWKHIHKYRGPADSEAFSWARRLYQKQLK